MKSWVWCRTRVNTLSGHDTEVVRDAVRHRLSTIAVTQDIRFVQPGTKL